jgi:hypothetical protein
MSSEFLTYTLPLVGIIVAGAAIAGYAAYLALSVWRGLVVPIYRSRALWTGLLAILFAVTIIFVEFINTIFPSFQFVASIVLYYGLFPLILAALFAWIDRTISILIRMDYQRRNLLGWKRFRFVYWGVAALVVVNPYIQIPIPQLFAGISVLVPFAYGSLAFVVGSKRTPDMTFRSHARWGGYSLVAIIVATLANYANYATPNVLLEDLPILLISYCFYKMSRFLVPIGTFTAPADPV